MTDFSKVTAEATVELSELTKAYEVQVQSLQKNLQREMKDAFKGFFKDNPEVAGLAWTQYTPYFNDGEECIFGVNDIYIINEESLKELKESNMTIFDLPTEWNFTYKKKEVPSYIQAAKSFVHTIASVPNDVMKATFGDHVQVIATAKGFDIAEYDHD